MTHSGAHSEAVTTAQALTGALDHMAAELTQVRAYGRRTRRISTALAVFGVFDILLTVLVTIFAVQVHDATTQASATVAELHKTQIAACQVGNQTLAKQILLWDHIAALSITPKTPPKQRKEDEQLLAFVRQTFAPRDCPKIYRLLH